MCLPKARIVASVLVRLLGVVDGVVVGDALRNLKYNEV